MRQSEEQACQQTRRSRDGEDGPTSDPGDQNPGSVPMDRTEAEEALDASQAVLEVPVREENARTSATGNISDLRNRPEIYTRMGLDGKTVRHASDCRKLPSGARIIHRRYVPVYS